MSIPLQKLSEIQERISDPDFLNKEGLQNKAGIHVFCYDPSDEMIVQGYVQKLKKETNTPYHIIEFDLYETFLSLLKDKHILDAAANLEKKRGKTYLLEQLQKIATPKALLSRIDYPNHQKGRDVLFMTGVGKIYPFIQLNNVFNSLDQFFDDIPVVMFYPGTYNGHNLILFGEIPDKSYYRTFNLL